MNLLSYGQTMVNLYHAVAPVSKNPLETANIEGPTTLFRYALIPFAPNAKVSLESSAINFYFPYQIGVFDLKFAYRTLCGDSRLNNAISGRMLRIMLDLYPPIPTGSDGVVHPITKIYQYAITGLEHVLTSCFPHQDPCKKKIDITTFDFEFKEKKIINELKVAKILQKTIAILKYAVKNEIKALPREKLNPLQIFVKDSYDEIFFQQIANGLDLVSKAQGKIAITSKWLCQNEFNSLNSLVQGKLVLYEEYLNKINKMPGYKDDNQLAFFPYDEKINEAIIETEDKDLEKDIIEINFNPEKNLTYDEIINEDINFNVNFTNKLKSHADYTESLGGDQWVEGVDYNIPIEENTTKTSSTNITTTNAQKRNSNENVLIY